MVFLLGGKMIFGDLMNSKPKKSTSSSSYIYSKKSFAVTKNDGENQTIIVSNNCPNNKGISNVGGPGDQSASVPIITHSASGYKGRLISQTHHTGVDVKHNSYERYLARKRGFNMRCQNC